ncbi:hypothetical protein [Paraburkholderia sp. GAS42]|uniref:hypothetical protein n=1 Tax=Paraburkholderia sp. GAS42 TaxID=3035135 RepID=UPI003D1BD8A5
MLFYSLDRDDHVRARPLKRYRSLFDLRVLRQNQAPFYSPIDIHQEIQNPESAFARRIAVTREYKQFCRQRKKREMLFAHLKRNHRILTLWIWTTPHFAGTQM